MRPKTLRAQRFFLSLYGKERKFLNTKGKGGMKLVQPNFEYLQKHFRFIVLSEYPKMTENQISKILVDIFIKVHSQLGPGLLERIYETTICYELTKRELSFKRQAGIDVYYDGKKMDIGFRADIIIEDKVIIELKSVEGILPVHHKTLLTYLKLSNLKLGLLVNFNVSLVKNGIYRIVNGLEE